MSQTDILRCMKATNDTPLKNNTMTENKESLVEMSVRIFDPALKIKIDLEFIQLLDLLKNYPGDLTAFIVRLKMIYDEMYIAGIVFSTRYDSKNIDIETIKQENIYLKQEIESMKAANDFQDQNN